MSDPRYPYSSLLPTPPFEMELHDRAHMGGLRQTWQRSRLP